MSTNPARLARVLLLVPALLALVGCSGGVYRQPEITLQNVQLGGLGLRGGTLLIDLKVVNPNRFSLTASQLSYDLRVRGTQQENDTAWVHFANGIVDLGTVRRFPGAVDPETDTADPQLGFQIPGRDSATVRIPVEFSYSGLGSAGATILRYGAFSYLAEGAVHANTPLGARRLPFRRIGTVTMGGAAR
jgi:hypothetical protein